MKITVRKSQHGFSLIEALVALLVMSFGMLAVAGFQINLSLNSDVAKQRTEATRLAQEKMEQLRTYENLTIYASTMVSSTSATEETITSSATNTVFTRSWGITTANTPDTGRSIQVTVAWTNRSGTAEQVQLFSYISATDPKLNGGLFFPLPDGTILRRPKNRNIDIPIPAVSIPNTGKSYIPWTGGGGDGTDPSYLVFSDDSGDIVLKCTDTPTADNLDDTSVCTTFDGYLLSGYITGGASQVAMVTRIGIPFGGQQYVDGTPECVVDSAYDQTTHLVIAGTKSYVCLIQPTDHDADANTARVWSGRIDIEGVTNTSLGGTYTCRFTTDANTTDNDNHPAVYSLVDRSLDNQNFYISSSNCSSTTAFRVLHRTNSGTAYHVTYDANSGSGAVPTDTTAYAEGNTVAVLTSPTPTKTGNNFLGWSLSTSGGVVTSFAMPANNATLYAQWTTAQTYLVTYDANGGAGTVPTDATPHTAGSTVTVLASPAPTRENFTFAGWSLSESGAVVTSFEMPAGNATLYAQWTTAVAYDVTYSANGGGGDLPLDNTPHLAGSTVSVIPSPAPARSGYAFAGWSLAAGGTTVASFTMPASDTTLYAKWTPVYTVTYDVNGGTGSKPTDTDSYAAGQPVAVKTSPVPTRSYFTFDGWSLSTTGTVVTSFPMPANNATLYARWTQIKLGTPTPQWSGITLSWTEVTGAIAYSVSYCEITNNNSLTACTPANPTSQTGLSVLPPVPLPSGVGKKDTRCYSVIATGSPYTPSNASTTRCIYLNSNGNTYTSQ